MLLLLLLLLLFLLLLMLLLLLLLTNRMLLHHCYHRIRPLRYKASIYRCTDVLHQHHSLPFQLDMPLCTQNTCTPCLETRVLDQQ